ncbi:MAG: Ldh family oxidoreductase [Candidatus Synoicihabitans palmerolidicus]|nr:Ldh family oxidoreductase [Candidatus Synoicihabitans palmerolidicus]
MSELLYVVFEAEHNSLVEVAYRHRGFNADEAAAGAKLCAEASRHGISTHNAIKALHLDHFFGTGSQGCVANVEIEEKPSRFAAAKIWNANRKLGQATTYAALEAAIRLADEYGVGMVSVDNAFHYLWGGGYVMEAARRGYVAYTNCTAALAEVVPFGGKYPTLGTNPHSWGFPTTEALGYPLVIDWATSVVAMGRVQQLLREGKQLLPHAAVDADGNPTTDPAAAKALIPFGAHKGYGLSLINELVGAFIGGSLPTIRNRGTNVSEGEKGTCCFFFQVWHPDAMAGGDFAQGRSQSENVKAVLGDVLGHGNEKCILPGQFEAQAAARCADHGGLLFSAAEVEAFN